MFHDSSMEWTLDLHSDIVIHSISPKNCGCNKGLSYLDTYTLSLQYISSVLMQLQVTEVCSLIAILCTQLL